MNNNIKSKNNLWKLIEIPGYKRNLMIPEWFEIWNFDWIVIISCLKFQELNMLSDSWKFDKNQLEKLNWMAITFYKLRDFFQSNYWKNIKWEVLIGDFGLSLLWEISDIKSRIWKQVSYQGNEITKFFWTNVEVGKLSTHLLEKNERKFRQQEVNQEEPTYADFINLMTNQKYKLSNDFIFQYISSYFDDQWNSKIERKSLITIFKSIEEHLELSSRLLKRFPNKILIYIWNEAKIRLLSAALQSSHENSMWLVWLSNTK